MEEELCGREAGQVGVLHEAPALRAVIVLDEVGQRAVLEAEGDSLTLNVLLPHHGDNLGWRVGVKNKENIYLKFSTGGLS